MDSLTVRRKHQQVLSVWILIYNLQLFLCFSIVAAASDVRQTGHKPVGICESKECLRSAANLALSMDLTADPCEDFYQFSCGNWAEEHPRPKKWSSYSWTEILHDKALSLVQNFFTRNSTKNSTNEPHAVQQAKDMFSACMDQETLDRRGLKPIFALLKSVGLPPIPTYLNITEGFDYSNYSFHWLDTVIKVETQLNMDVIIGLGFSRNFTNSSIRLLKFTPGTSNPISGLRTKRHNLKKDKLSAVQHLINFNLTDDKTPENDNKEHKEGDDKKDCKMHNFVIELMKMFVNESGLLKGSKLTETELSNNFIAAEDILFNITYDIHDIGTANKADDSLSRNFSKPQFTYTVDELQARTDKFVKQNNATPSPIWKKYLEGVFQISNVTLDFDNDKILEDESDLKYMEQIAAYVAKTPPVVLELYIWFAVVKEMAAHASLELRTLLEKEEYLGSRTSQCVDLVSDMLDMAVVYGIADHHFFNSTKPKTEEMLFELKTSTANLMRQAKWMDNSSKLASYEKINEMESCIGIPNWLLEEGKLDKYYEEIIIDTNKHFENVVHILQIQLKKSKDAFRAIPSSDHECESFTSPTKNYAEYSFLLNTIGVYLTMLQFPFFDLGLDSLDYGALGTVIAHEITHGFDNRGRLFNKGGNFVQWWSNETIALFENKTKCFIDQYDRFYIPEIDKYVNGTLTLAENIADNGGVKEALAALQNHLSKTGPEQKLPGFGQYTSEQMFFLAFGNSWCNTDSVEHLEDQNVNDEHAPARARVITTLQNMEDFAKAWNCPAGSNMNPDKRCIVY